MQGIKTGILGLALSSFVGNAWAADACARLQDITAMQAAAVQQELMVAAFTCKDDGLYNSFVITYQGDLQRSDRALLDFFLRVNTVTGTADYHSFKTRLANSYSLRSTSNERLYCTAALRTFRAALNEGRKSLAEFVMAEPVSFNGNYDSCGERIEGGAMTAQIAAPAPQVAAVTSESVVAGGVGVAAVAPNAPAAKQQAVAPAGTDSKSASVQNGNTYSTRNRGYIPPPPPARARRYDARGSYERPPSDSYGYSNRYGDRDPYYRNPYDRYWYGYYYGRR
jgi:hypothetical protein